MTSKIQYAEETRSIKSHNHYKRCYQAKKATISRGQLSLIKQKKGREREIVPLIEFCSSVIMPYDVLIAAELRHIAVNAHHYNAGRS